MRGADERCPLGLIVKLDKLKIIALVVDRKSMYLLQRSVPDGKTVIDAIAGTLAVVRYLDFRVKVITTVRLGIYQTR